MASEKVGKKKLSLGIPSAFVAGAVITGSAFAAGLLLFSGNSDDSTTTLSQDSSSSRTEATSDSNGNSAKGTRHEVSSLQALAEIKGEFALNVALYDLLDGANESQLVALAIDSNEIFPKRRQSVIQESIYQRFAELNPTSALKQIRSHPAHRHEVLVETVFSEWAQTELDASVAHANKLQGRERTAALTGILRSRDDLSEALRKEIARELGNERVAIDMITQSSLEQSFDNPESAWNTLINDAEANIGQTALLVQIAQAWVDQAGFAVVGKISESLSGWQERAAIMGSVLYRAAQSDPAGAFATALNFDSDPNNFIKSTIAEAWAQKDPQAALDAIAGLESGRSRNHLEESVIGVWARNDPYSVLDSLDQLPEGVRWRGQEWAINQIAASSPEDAAILLSSVEDERAKINLAHTVAWNWASIEPHSALDWVLSSPDVEPVKRDLLEYVLAAIARDDPHAALETALDQPIGDNEIGLEAGVVSEVARRDLTSAVAMLDMVRDGRTKIQAYSSVGSAYVRNDQTDRALKLGQGLGEPGQSNYYRSVVWTWARSDPIELLDSITQLPNDQIMSSAAMYLTNSDRWQRNTLSEEQIEYARSFISEEDAQNMQRRRGDWRRR